MMRDLGERFGAMIRLPQESLAERGARLAPDFQIVRPDGPGPFPVIVMLHGCGRPDGPQPHYAEAARRAGIASIIVNSYRVREISLVEAASLVCTGMRLWGRERAGDVLAALHWARQQPWADPQRLGAIGWSHGGWTVMDSLAVTSQVARHASLTGEGPTPLDGLRWAGAVYPWCGTGSQTIERGWQVKVPFAVVIGGRDTVAWPGMIERAVSRLQADGVEVAVQRLPSATHSFDEDNSINPTVVQDPAQRALAIDFLVAEAARHLGAPRPGTS